MKNDIFLNNLKIEELRNNSKDNESSFVFNNLPNELSITLGNYYRRIILSYMSGISIFALRISNKSQQLESEFSILKGLVETPPYMIMNLRKISFSSKENYQEEENKTFKLEIDIENDTENDRIIKSSDIKDLSGNIEVLNNDVYIATLSPFSSLKIEIYCRNNWGYSRSEENSSLKSLQEEDRGFITIDSNYNPILNVSYTTDFVVTGLEEQNEKLVIKIETNGSLSPKEALVKALQFSLDVNKKVLENLNGEQSSD